jgi:hypothetical protein
MPLRKSTQLTPGLLAANRRNATRSTGRRTLAGKHYSKMNALKLGGWAALRALRVDDGGNHD